MRERVGQRQRDESCFANNFTFFFFLLASPRIHAVYDLLEVGIDRFEKEEGKQNPSTMVFSPKPSFAFAGEEFNTVAEFKQFKSILVDAFRGRVVDSINLKGVDRIIMCTPSVEKENQVR